MHSYSHSHNNSSKSPGQACHVYLRVCCLLYAPQWVLLDVEGDLQLGFPIEWKEQEEEQEQAPITTTTTTTKTKVTKVGEGGSLDGQSRPPPQPYFVEGSLWHLRQYLHDYGEQQPPIPSSPSQQYTSQPPAGAEAGAGAGAGFHAGAGTSFQAGATATTAGALTLHLHQVGALLSKTRLLLAEEKWGPAKQVVI